VWGRVGTAILLLLVTGCAGTSTQFPTVSAGETADERLRQQVFQIQKREADLARLGTVAYRMELANRTDCGEKVAPRWGFTAAASPDLPADVQTAAVEALDLAGDQPTVVYVIPGGPAAKAGIAHGDVLVAVNNEPVPNTKFIPWLDEREKADGVQPLAITIARAGKTRSVSLVPVMACSMPVILATSGQANAFTDGKRIVLYSRILEIAPTDDELALVVGHEMAHINMKHIEKHAQNRVVGALGGAVVDIALAVVHVNTGGAFARGGANAGGTAFSMDFEKEADYVGAYYVARAGYSVRGAEQLWRAFAAENPRQTVYAGLHPTSPERFIQMEKTVEEIERKRAHNQPLTPEMKQPPTADMSKPAASGAAVRDSAPM
jgi:beta-barrel assembly-enhancing protease